MVDSLVIEKNRTLLTSQDYAALRELGVEHVQRLSGSLWTDHNLHDPGITTLEILCYALTDLGYRTAFSVVDLLTKPDGELDPPETSGLFPAHETLTCTPLTIDDYRRLLLKIEGIRNAWLDPMNDPEQVGNYRESETPIYADCLEDRLSYDPTNASGDDNHRVRLTGLYKVRLELEVDDVLGSLNERRLVYRIPRGALKGVVISLDSEQPALVDGTMDFSRDLQQVDSVSPLTATPAGFTTEVNVRLDDGAQIVLEDLVIRVVDDRPDASDAAVEVTASEIETVLRDDETDGLIPLFWRKQQKRQQSIAAACCVLDAHRNLCEDYLEIRVVDTDRFAMCADIDVESAVDLETVHAQVFYEIEKYLNPPIHYYTLQELFDEGWTPDKIFNGPFIDFDFTCGGEKVFTKPGFIKQEDLDASQLRQVIYVSDIINLLMDVEGVVAVKNLLLRRLDENGNPVGDSEKWCMAVTPGHQPVLVIDRSKILSFKGEIPFRAESSEFEDAIDRLRAMDRKAVYVDPNQVLESPTGAYREPDRFFSIQHDYPQTYAIGEAGLPATAQASRVAQARQMKTYLTCYDQLLADYLAQLANVRRVLSIDASLRQTYFSQYLSDIPGVREAFEDECYVDKTLLQDDALRTRLTEDEALYRERRNRFLDHLLARFAEQFTDYALMMFGLDGSALATGDELIADKIQFLSEYPVVSRERHKAFNYRPENPAQIWDTDNVSGLEKRVSRLMGIANYQRRNLTCDELFGQLFTTGAVGVKFRVEIRDAQDAVLFASQEVFPSESDALDAALELYPVIRVEKGYAVDDSGGTGQVFFTVSADGASLRHDELFQTEADAVQAIRAIIDRHDEILLSDDVCNDEGFHLFEHILLRPFTDQDELMQVCLDKDCEFCGEEDHYSFRISVVLPYWPTRFQSLDFRSFFERTLRQETPAHIHARICWIDNRQMAALDERYRAWAQAKASKDVDQTALTDAARELIQLLQQLKTVYPAAILHDCDDGGDENLVRLGSTNLGIF